jgi:hypothetical protein
VLRWQGKAVYTKNTEELEEPRATISVVEISKKLSGLSPILKMALVSLHGRSEKPIIERSLSSERG